MTKRIISVLLALVLVLALSTSALAETLTINDPKNGADYEAYQVFKGTYLYENNVAYLGDLAWGDGVDATNAALAVRTPAEWAVALTEGTVTAKEFADIVSKALVAGKAKTAEVADTKAVFTGLETGYYFVKEVNVADGENGSAFILEIVGNAETNTKRSGVPTVEKTQSEADHTYEVGETITFTITANIPADNYEEYDKYYFQIWDKYSAELDFLEVKSVQIKDGETEELRTADASKYDQVVTSNPMTWTWADTKADGIEGGDSIIVTYTAKLNDKAYTVDNADNTVKVKYNNDSNSEGEGDTWSTEDTELLFTLNLNGLKVDGGSETVKTLAGAEFVLLTKEGEGENIVEKFYKKTTDDVEFVEGQTNGDVMITKADGEFGFTGLDAGTYYLREIKAPLGYNVLTEDIKVEIVTEEVDGKLVFKTLTNATVVENSVTPTAAATVENNKGTTLPETGGIGTTIFYLVGGLMMAAAVVLLVAKKRTVNE